MEESKLIALHESLSKLRKTAGLGQATQYSWQRTAHANNITKEDSSVFKKTSDGKTIRKDGLPVNSLYNNFVKEGAYDPTKKGSDGDGRAIKRDFTDCNSDDDDEDAHVVSAPSSSSESSEDEGKSSKEKRRLEKRAFKEKRKAEKKAALKAAKFEAKRLAKLEEKKRLKNEAKKALKLKLKEEDKANASSSFDEDIQEAPPRKKFKKSNDKNASKKEVKQEDRKDRKKSKKSKKEKR